MKRRIFPWVPKSILKYFVYKEEWSLPLVVPPTCSPSLPAWWLLVVFLQQFGEGYGRQLGGGVRVGYLSDPLSRC